MQTLSEILDIEHPIILAPMFLISNERMTVAALNSGISAAIPALNFRNTDDLRDCIRSIKKQSKKPFGINLIVNKSNYHYKEQLALCCEEKVNFIITSLGSPEETIRKAHDHGIKVFCDVTDLNFAKKVEELGADALIAVGSEAGGHSGKIQSEKLCLELLQHCKIPIISAGGIGDKASLDKRLALGVAGVSVGSIFIASDESPVSMEYKRACVDYGAKDIVMTTKLSGTPCTVINTEYVKKIGTKQNFLERILNRNKRLKKWFKALVFLRGMKNLQKAAFSSTYKTVWCAGPSIEYVESIRPISKIVESLFMTEKL